MKNQKHALSLLVVLALILSLIPTTFSATAAEPEEIVLKTFTDNLATSSTVKAHTVVLSEPGRVYLSFNHANLNDSHTYWFVTMRDSDNYTVLDLSSAGNVVDTNSYVNYLRPGTYTVEIKANTPYMQTNYYSNANYTLTVNFTENTGQFETEYNNTKEESNGMSENKAITGNLYKSDDVDFYKLTLDKPGKMTLNFKHANLNDNHIYWFVTMRDNDNYTVLDLSSAGNVTDTNSYINYLRPGTYTVEIKANTPYMQTNYHSRADYTLSINFTENTGQFETEHNNTKEKANEMSKNKEMTGNLYKSDDVDFYKFTLDKPGKVTLNFKHANFNDSHTYWFVTMRDNNNYTVLNLSSAGNVVDTNSNSNYLSPGTYTIEIKANTPYMQTNYHSRADYTLTVNISTSALGDVNGDDKVDALDASLVLQHDAGLVTLKDDALAAADVNGDKKIDALDASLILQFDAGLISKFK